MDATAVVAHLAESARKAARTLSLSSGEERKNALRAIAEEIEKQSALILDARACIEHSSTLVPHLLIKLAQQISDRLPQ